MNLGSSKSGTDRSQGTLGASVLSTELHTAQSGALLQGPEHTNQLHISFDDGKYFSSFI